MCYEHETVESKRPCTHSKKCDQCKKKLSTGGLLA